ncbi:MAG: cytochrome c oxidase assembly protein, partial [Rhodocyclales bacterium CG17_big_fil_post_rev_8_21_14_2_50_68_7]
MSVAIRTANRRILTRMLLVAVLMFGFGYAMVPLYRVFCDVTGINNLLGADEVAMNTQVDTSRNVTVEFDANIRGLPWNFKPERSSIIVHPGELAQVRYRVQNTRDHPLIGQAIPSYGPQLAGQYFRKIECFCFTRQRLAAGEVREMPVVFVIDPGLPREV